MPSLRFLAFSSTTTLTSPAGFAVAPTGSRTPSCLPWPSLLGAPLQLYPAQRRHRRDGGIRASCDSTCVNLPAISDEKHTRQHETLIFKSIGFLKFGFYFYQSTHSMAKTLKYRTRFIVKDCLIPTRQASPRFFWCLPLCSSILCMLLRMEFFQSWGESPDTLL